MIAYRETIDKMPLQPSDRKKLLSMPWAFSKRAENPTPKRGQPEFDLFTELSGRDWNDDHSVREDNEFKITEFDYENYLSPELLKEIDTNEESFKDFVKMLNFTTETKHEKFLSQKKT